MRSAATRSELRRNWPAMKESAEFCLDWLVEDPQTGKFVSGPANSPENAFITPDGEKTYFSMGPTMDQEIIWDHFTNVLDAATALEIDDDFVRQVAAARERLLLPKVGSDGRLLEWAEEFAEVDPHHRHCSHLFALHPGRQITLARHARSWPRPRGSRSKYAATKRPAGAWPGRSASGPGSATAIMRRC